ncbi:hypothetical protein [Litoribrevibacter albus]|uniref:Carboxymuconolactone decarboxylase family protein n=1 Tax=Litoribrevibacter albus TaxID=1473156 RepID=A0AA37SDG8_9GAMM|nr:hypothetical protein [Litoribrevibacter albus]GLQ32571.1 hypothetical protein GCM10007876_30500 [Litoribrevibacter albus]
MSNYQEQLQQLTDFENHYQYDAQYLKDMLTLAYSSYEKFAGFQPMASHRDLLPLEAFWVAKVAGMQTEDCGGCLELTIKMAKEQGVSSDILNAALKGGQALPEALQVVYQYARQVAGQGQVDQEVMDAISESFSKGQLLEFGVIIAATKVFPTVKRAVGMKEACALISVDAA